MSDQPRRVQLSRRKGWRMPANTVKVSRPTKWGNPFTVTTKLNPGSRVSGASGYYAVPTVEDAVEAFREMLSLPGERAEGMRADLHELRGKHLACWCPLSDACHADVLLELANASAPPAPREGTLDVSSVEREERLALQVRPKPYALDAVASASRGRIQWPVAAGSVCSAVSTASCMAQKPRSFDRDWKRLATVPFRRSLTMSTRATRWPISNR